MKLPDTNWNVIREYFERFEGWTPDETLRRQIETGLDVRLYEWGAIVVSGNMFDVYVNPDRRNEKVARHTMEKVIDELMHKHGSVKALIHKDNAPSLRLADIYKFTRIGEDGDNVVLEKVRWAA